MSEPDLADRLRRLVVDLADQQAMHDNWWAAELDALLSELQSLTARIAELEGAMRKSADLAGDGRRTASLPAISRTLNEALARSAQGKEP